MTTTWRKEMDDMFKDESDSWDKVVLCTLSDDELDREFDDGYGGEEGLPFTIWTEEYVYFPVCYDGSEWVGRVPRNPNGKATEHVGG
jgi:hypothetical protein